MRRLLEVIVLFVGLILSVGPTYARYQEHGFAAGAFGGVSAGYAPNCDPGCDKNYQSAPYLLSLYYKWDPDHNLGLRLNLGGIHYLNDAHFVDSETITENLLIELSAVITLTSERSLFSPYVVAGIAWPSPIQFGFGNEFALSRKISILTEVLGSSFITIDNHAEGRLGVMWHF